MSEEYDLNSDGTSDVWNFPSLAHSAIGTAGLLYNVTIGAEGELSINNGVLYIGTAYNGKPGLFTGLKDNDGNYYPRLIEGTKEREVRLPVYAKRVKDINDKYWQLSELADKGSWQAATLAKCVIQPATDTTEEKAIYLKLHTERGGDTLVFELTTDINYSGV